MTAPHLPRQDEDLSAPEFGGEERADAHDFGDWPEVFGLVAVALLCWLTFAFTG